MFRFGWSYCRLVLCAILANTAAVVCAEGEPNEAALIRSLSGAAERQGPTLTLQSKKSRAVSTDISCDPDPTVNSVSSLIQV
jgi:hypothetical protein